MRLLLLGEQLIAFRDSAGRVGVMDHRCPHRCASLFLGRNEENGIRCVYHGWKYDTEGNCVDTPNLTGPARLQEPDQGQGLQDRRAQRPRLGLYGQPRRRPRRCRKSRRRCCPKPTCRSRSCSANATGCRPWKATSTPRISAFCMPAASIPTMCRRTACSATRSPTARPTTTSPTPSAARCTPPIARRRRAGPTGALPISCCRSGPRRRRASSPSTCTTAPGSRWTTPTRCSSA